MRGNKQNSPLHHRQVGVKGISIHVVEGGSVEKPAVLFLHGWPESWAAFESIMLSLADTYRVVAIDLPGVGESKGLPTSNDKKTLAGYVHELIETLGLEKVTLVGHDAGGQIVYAYLHRYPEALRQAVIMNVVVPGVEPWSEVVRNPYIWHFAFHSIPGLPEKLVEGKQADYFAFFYNVMTADPDAVSVPKRKRYTEAYTRPEALHTGFEWYRAFAQDEQDNLSVKGQTVQTPVLYLRGEQEGGDLETYLKGFRESGLQNIQGQLVPGIGHWLDENPEGVLAVLEAYLAV